MLTALVLICSLSTTPDLKDCTKDNALDILRVPTTFSNPATCFMHGQAYVADTSIGRDISANEVVKVVCARDRPPVKVESGPVRSTAVQ
jgi:hypothetical protein